MSAIITVENLTINYGDYCALQNISFSVEKGDFLAVVGQNGSGKTTLVKAIVRLVKPTSGSVIFHNSQDIIGYLPQKTTSLDPRFPASVEEIVISGIRTKDKMLAKKKLREVLDLLEISDISKRKIGQLSGGQQQRAILARALINSPTILILDEPTGALDPSSRSCFYNTIKEMNKNGATVIMVSHDFHDIEKYVKTIALIDRTLLSYGNLQDFLASEAKHYFKHAHKHG
ncbi:MAG: metal ABC transporter ATP-binding protein [Chitinivibrionia bacterium]|nr:metal ABC transporter ATP-binding protein [Chitinivibrionia bacterium]